MASVRVRSDLRLAYWDDGRRDPAAIVLVPGPTDSWRSYEPVLPWLPDDLRVVAVSLRGHGGSSKPASGYRIEDLASDVEPFLDALGIERAVLVGHSGSALVVRRVALDAPDRVAGLVLESAPTTLRGDEGLQRFVDTFVASLTVPIDRDRARSFVVDTSTEDLDPAFVERLVDDLLEVPSAAWNEMFRSLLAYDDTAELSRIDVPVSLVWGDADPLVSRSMQDRLLRLLPTAELSVLRGVRHTPRWEVPEGFARTVDELAVRVLVPD